MSIFHMSIFKVPSHVLKTLESILSRFFNGQDHKSRKASWVGNGDSSSFWEDKWRVRSEAEESQFNSLLEIVQVINLVPCEDRYFWSLDSEKDYSVASIRKLIDEKRFQEFAKMVWRLQAICFFNASCLNKLRKFSSWWNVDYTDARSYDEWRVWLVSIRVPNKLKTMMEGVFYDEPLGLKAGFKKVKIFKAFSPNRAIKAYCEEGSSDGKRSVRSSDYPFDSDSFDGTDKTDSEEMD
nr:hypothetical protein [Tanacetum cinerariifolium]